MRPKLDEFVSCPGERYAPVYTPDISEDGIITLVETGKKDLFEIHQADEPVCNINNIVARFLATGDSSVINQVNGFYDDFTGAPKSLAEAMSTLTRAEGVFAQLPVEIREKFDHNFYKFVASAGSKEFWELFAPKSVESEVKTDAE